MAPFDRDIISCEFAQNLLLDRCKCGDLVTEGEGNSKKTSKKMAAKAMLEKLPTMGSTESVCKQKTKNIANKKKNRNLIKVCQNF